MSRRMKTGKCLNLDTCNTRTAAEEYERAVQRGG
jgi:hypothetical protein